MKGMRHPSDHQLYLFSEGALDRAEVENVSAHMGQCPECQRRVESYRSLRHAMGDLPDPVSSAEEFNKRLTVLPTPSGSPGENRLPVVKASDNEAGYAEKATSLSRHGAVLRKVIAFPARREPHPWRRGAVALAAATIVGGGAGMWAARAGFLPFLAQTAPDVSPTPLAPPRIGAQVLAPGGEMEVEILEGQRGGAYTSELRIASPGPPRALGGSREYGKVVGLGSPPQGTELLFEIHVRETGNVFRIGPAERNPDGMAHAAVQPLAGGEAIIGFEDISKGGDGRYKGPDKGYNDILFYLKKPGSPPLKGKYVASLPMPGENWDVNRPVGASIATMARVGGRVISDGRALAVEVYKASDSVYADEFRLASPGPPKFLGTNRGTGKIIPLGKFPKGTELVFEMKNPDTGKVYRTGPASRNADGVAHAAVQAGPDGQTLVGFEDIDKEGNDRFSKPDYNYSDLLFRVFPVEKP